MVLAWLATDMPRALARAAAATALGLTLVHLGLAMHSWQVLNRGLAEYTSGIADVGPNSTILPISYDHKGESARVGVYRHAGSYYSVAARAVDLANYEAAKAYFPLTYKPALDPWKIIGSLEGMRSTIRPERYPLPIDYILLWSAPPQFAVRAWIEANYELVHSEGRVRIYKRVAGVRQT
jgi:hypothetical protein